MTYASRAAVLGAVLVSAVAWLPTARAADKTDAAACAARAAENNDDDDDDDPSAGGRAEPPGNRFAISGTCHKISGSAAITSQLLFDATASGVLGLLGRAGPLSPPRDVYTGIGALRWESKRKTTVGDLATAAELGWSKASNDDTAAGALAVNELYLALAGTTAGYTNSLMQFLEPRLPIQDARETRPVGILSYTRDLSDTTTLSLAIESPMPISSSTGIETVSFKSPVATIQWRYENELVLQSTLLARQADLPSAVESHPLGCAARFGATLPLKALGKTDTISGQFTYGVNAAPYIGPTRDVGAIANVVQVTGPSWGWSAVGFYHRMWSESWETNVFATHMELDLVLQFANPWLRLTRYGANIVFLPTDRFRIGAEIDLIELETAANGALGLLPGSGGRATLGYLFAEWKF